MMVNSHLGRMENRKLPINRRWKVNNIKKYDKSAMVMMKVKTMTYNSFNKEFCRKNTDSFFIFLQSRSVLKNQSDQLPEAEEVSSSFPEVSSVVPFLVVFVAFCV